MADEIKKSLSEAMEHLMNLRYRWPEAWLICYYDPTLSHEENCRLAAEAVASGWTPDSIVIERREPIPFFPDSTPQPCREMTVEEIRKRYPDKSSS